MSDVRRQKAEGRRNIASLLAARDFRVRISDFRKRGKENQRR
jgi:hypothetical protein